MVLGQGLAFALLPIITHYLSPAAYGEYALALAMSSLVDTLGASWIRNVSMRLYFDAKASGRTKPFYWNVGAFQALLFIAFYLLAILIALIFHLHLVAINVLLAAGLAVLLEGFYSNTVSLMRAEKQSLQFAIAEVSNGLIRFIVTVGALWMGFRSPTMLFLATAIAAAIAGAVAAGRLQPRLVGRLAVDWPLIKSISRIGPPAIPLSISGWFEQLADRLVLAYFATAAVVGIYSAGYGLASRVISGLVSAVFMMAWPDILNAWTEGGRDKARQALSQALRLFLWLTLGPLVFMMVFSDQLVTWLLGATYQQAATVIPIVALATWLAGFKTYLNRHLELNKRYGVISMVSSIGALVNLALNIALIPRMGMLGAAYATLGNYVVAGSIFFIIRDQHLVRFPYRDILGALGLSFVAWLPSRALALPVYQVAVFILIYLLGLGTMVLGGSRIRSWRRAKHEARESETADG